MSLADKMELWEQKDTAEDPSLDPVGDRGGRLQYTPSDLVACGEEIRAHPAYSRFMGLPRLLHGIKERMALNDSGNMSFFIPIFSVIPADAASSGLYFSTIGALISRQLPKR
jgi:hypothetical protein